MFFEMRDTDCSPFPGISDSFRTRISNPSPGDAFSYWPPAVRCGLLLFAALGLATLSASAVTTNRWTNAVSSVWRETTNWSAGQLPSTRFDFIVISNTGSKTVTIDSATALANLSVRGLVVSAPTGFTNTLQMLNIPSGTPFTSSRTVSIERNGILNIVNSTFNAQSTFDITSGSL